MKSTLIILSVTLSFGLLNAQNDIRIENSDNVETVVIRSEVASDQKHGRIFLKQQDGKNGLLLDGGEGTSGGQINLYNSAGVVTTQIDADISTGPFFGMYANDGDPGIIMYGDQNGDRGGAIWLRDEKNQTNVIIQADQGTNNGGGIQLRNAAGELTINIDAENGVGGPSGLFLYDRDGNLTTRLRATGGSVFTDKVTIQGSDFAERFNVSTSSSSLGPEPGTLLVIDDDQPGALRPCTSAYDTKIAGIVSGAGGINPGMVMGEEGTLADGDTHVALAGRVYVKADATYGAIEIGDFLTTSDTEGYAMKAKKFRRSQGAIIGKAMTSLKKGEKGLVLVLINQQ